MLYRTDDEHRALVTDYLRLGLELGQKVVYIHAVNSPDTIIGYLSGTGVATAFFLERGQLVFLAAPDVYLRNGQFDPNAMITLLRSEAARAQGEGYTALRATSEMSWSLHGHPGSERLIEYESLLNNFYPGSTCLGLCQYDQRLFDPAALLPVVAIHPIVAVGGDLFENPYDIGPDQVHDSTVSSAILEKWIQGMAGHQRTAAALLESEDRYRLLFDQSVDAVFVTTRDGELETANPATSALLGYDATELPGMDVRQIYADPAGRANFQAVIEATGFVKDYDVRIRCKDGSLKECQMTVTLRRGPHGEPIGYQGIVRDVTAKKQAEAERLRLLRDLDKRVRELTALRQLAVLLQEGPEVDATLMQCVASLLPAAWQYPDIAAARVRYGNLVAASSQLRVTPWRQSADFSTGDGRTGLLEVFYLEERPAAAEGPFLLEERQLIDAAAEMLRSYCERQRAEAEYRRANRALTALSACNQVLLHATTEAELLQAICRAIVEKGGYRLVWVGYAEHDAGKTLRPVAQCGYEDGYLKTVNVTWADTERGRGPGGTAIRTAQTYVVRNVLQDPRFAPWREEAHKRGYASVAALPLLVEDDEPLGVLAMYAAQPDAFDPAEMELLQELAADLAYGITSLRLREENERAAAALVESEQRLQAVLDHTLSVVYMRDLDGRYLLVNQRFEELFGVPVEKAIGRTNAELLSAGLAEQFRESDERALAATEPLLFEHEIADGGGMRTFLTSKFALRDAAGNPYAICGMSTEITERKRAEQVQHMLAAIVESSEDAIVSYGPDGRILSWNQAAKRMLGYSAAEATGQQMSFLAHAETKVDQEAIRATLQSGEGVAPMETVLQRKDGSPIAVSLTLSPIRNAAGGPVSFAAIIRDITARKRAEAQIRRQVERLTALRTIDTAITSSFDQRLTLGTVLEQVTRLLGVDAAAVFLLNTHTLMLEFTAGRGFRTGSIRKSSLRMGQGFGGMACLERRTVCVPNLLTVDPPFVRRDLLTDEAFIAYWAVPLIVKGQVRGLMECFHRGPLQTDADWMEYLEALAGQAAVAIDNSQLFSELQRSNTDLLLTYDTTLAVWVRVLDMHFRDAASQTPRIVAATERLARAAGVAEADVVHLRRGAMLHDVGMAALPDRIVLKPAPLTPEEWTAIRQHPAHAYGMLSTIPYLRLASDIPYCHHERWDGSGYPRGLKGEQIPQAARVFAVVDTWDALLANRPYRKAWPPDQVLEHIVGGAGSLFDPEVVDLFQRLWPELSP